MNVTASPRPTRVRLRMLGLLFVTVVINYMDRSNLALLAPLVSKDLGLSSVQMGLLFSAFGWAYVAGQLPGGWIVDTFTPRVLYPLMMGAWSLVTCAQAIAGSFASLCGLRLGMGLLEAPSFPTNAKVVTAWFPEQERARAIGFYVSGQFVGLAFIAPVLAYTQTLLGWRGAFFATGAIGLVFSVVWYLVYRDPAGSSANAAELEHIRQGGGTVGATVKKSGPTWTWTQLRIVLGTRSLWGVFLGHTCVTATLWFFLTWFPSYLVDYRKMGFIKMGVWTSVPFIAAFVGVILSGTLSDFLVRRGASLATARKTPVVSGLLLSMSIVGANYVERESLVMLFMTVAFFGNGLASIGWSFVSALAPANLIGTTGALYNFIGNSSAIFVPIVIGWLVRGGSFEPALIFIGACALVGAFAYGVMVRDVSRIAVDRT